MKKVSFYPHDGSTTQRSGSEVLAGLDKIIFPSNKWIKRWDMLVLVDLMLLSFLIPYELGVSAGYLTLESISFLIFRIFLNGVLAVDTFLYFFRAFRHENSGQVEMNLRVIRNEYLRTWFVPNLLASLPYTLVFYFTGKWILEKETVWEATDKDRKYILLLKLAECLRLLRLYRPNSILQRSDGIVEFRQKRSNTYEIIMNMIFIVLLSHWFACIWAFVGHMGATSLEGEGILQKNNWIHTWYEQNYVKGGPYPIGLENHLDRYVISLFWAIQTITSIGYGNISPVTRLEWWTGCALQLIAGIFWAYLLGSLIGVISASRAREIEYFERCAQANRLISLFPEDKAGSDESDKLERNVVAHGIRDYMHKSYLHSKTKAFRSTIAEAYPFYNGLSPRLQKTASGMLMNKALERIPYLSSRFLSTEDQCQVAIQCSLVVAPAGELVDFSKLERGIYVFIQGTAASLGNQGRWKMVTAGKACGFTRVLFDNGHTCSLGGLYFLSFSKMAFIPRSAVLEVLERNPRAWKACARWIYLQGCLRHWYRMRKEDGLA